MARWPWMERTFTFDFPTSKMPDLLERLRGTPPRIEDRIRGTPRDRLTRRDGKGWSIQENIGHLIDLGYLPSQRIDQILAGATVLIAADMANRKTADANHNARSIDELIATFRHERGLLIEKFLGVPESDWGRSALHPRIQKPMRIVDIVYFDAEHDDYHLARIGALVDHWKQIP